MKLILKSGNIYCKIQHTQFLIAISYYMSKTCSSTSFTLISRLPSFSNVKMMMQDKFLYPNTKTLPFITEFNIETYAIQMVDAL